MPFRFKHLEIIVGNVSFVLFIRTAMRGHDRSRRKALRYTAAISQQAGVDRDSGGKLLDFFLRAYGKAMT